MNTLLKVIIVLGPKSYTKIGTKTMYRLCSICECSSIRIHVQKQTIPTYDFHGYWVRSNKSAYNNLVLENKHGMDKLNDVYGKDKQKFLLHTSSSIFPPYFHVLK